MDNTHKIVIFESISNKLFRNNCSPTEYMLYFELGGWEGFDDLERYEKSAVLECAVILYNRINSIFCNRLMSIQGVASFIGIQLDDHDNGLSYIVDLRDIDTPQDKKEAIIDACEKWVSNMDW